MALVDSTPHALYRVASHTDNVGEGSTFVAISGYQHDGVDYIPVALKKGATTIVIQKKHSQRDAIFHLVVAAGAQLFEVEDTRQALAQLSAQAYGFPARKLKLVGVTGTQGKTTTSWMTAHILRHSGKKVALLSSAGNAINFTNYPATLTTGQPDYLHWFFAQCVEAGIEWVVVEIAAQALTLHRVAGLQLQAVVFTNFFAEHSEFYATQADYFAAKKQIFDLRMPDAPALVAIDYPAVAPLAQQYSQCSTLSLQQPDAGIFVDSCTSTQQGLKFSLQVNKQRYGVYMPSVLGEFNAANAASACFLARACGVPWSAAAEALKTFQGVPGRMLLYRLPNQIMAAIDYADHPVSFRAVLTMLRQHFTSVTVLFGCGGDRDADKRPIMGAEAASLADLVILTTDNPRSEDPLQIVAQIQAGITEHMGAEVLVELDRAEAIKLAYRKTIPGGVIALLGKGPEEYQLIAGKKVPFSERAVLEGIIREQAR